MNGEYPPEVLKLMEECGKEFKIDDVMKPVPPEKNCFHKCVAEKTGMLGKDNQIHIESLKEYLKKVKASPELTALADECIKLKEADLCATIAAIRKCMHP